MGVEARQGRPGIREPLKNCEQGSDLLKRVLLEN